jgi:hypothetical protein
VRRLAELVLALYPFAYRQRYGEEMRALLDETGADARAVLDLGRGALIAHLRPAVRAVDAENRLRLSTKGILLCWVFFAAAGLGFYKTLEGAAFTALGDAHPTLSALYLSIQIVATLASAAVLVGATPLVLVGLRQRESDRRDALRFAVALGLLVTVAMWAIVVAVGTEAVLLSGLPFSAIGNGPGGLVSVEFSIVLQLAVMSAAAACASVSLVRGWAA